MKKSKQMMAVKQVLKKIRMKEMIETWKLLKKKKETDNGINDEKVEERSEE